MNYVTSIVEWVNNLLKIFQRTNLFNYSANINEKPQ